MNVAINKMSSADVRGMLRSSSHFQLTEIDQQTMDYCLRMSTSLWCGIVEGKPVCAWGLIPPSLMSNQAYLWLFITELVREHTFIFVRYSQLAVEEMLEEFPLIVGHAHVERTKSIRWLRWLGAKFGEPQGKLIPFRIEKHG